MVASRPPWRGARLAAALFAAAVGVGCASGPASLAPTSADIPPAAPVVSAALAPAVVPSAQPAVAEPAAPAAPAGPLAPRARLDPSQDAERGDLWQRVRDGFAMPEQDGDLVRKWERFYAAKPEYVERMTARGARYLFHVLEEVEKRQLPFELALLPFIESAFNPQAVSRARATGMWQFMPATGKDFELRQNVFRDDRRDVLASTRAALDYLQRLHAQFGDWPLALAAYNWGQGNVLRAQARNRSKGKPTDYASLQMPDETRNYLPKLQAVKNIVARPEAFALRLQPLENHPFFLSVPVDRDIDVALAARLAGMSLDDFQQLNPQMNKPVILAAGTPQLLLPYDNANRFVRELASHPGPMASWTAWVAPKTLKPSEVARLTGMPEAELREINLIPPRMLVKLGSTLLVPRPASATNDVASHLAHHANMSLAPEAAPPRRISGKAGARSVAKPGVKAVAKTTTKTATKTATAVKSPHPTATSPKRKAASPPPVRVAAAR